MTGEFVENLAVDGPGRHRGVGDPADDEQVKAEGSEDGETDQSCGIAGETCQLDLAQVGEARPFARISDDGSANQGVSLGAKPDVVEALTAPNQCRRPPGLDRTGSSRSSRASTATLPPTSSRSWVRTGGPLGGLGYDVRMRPDDPDRRWSPTRTPGCT